MSSSRKTKWKWNITAQKLVVSWTIRLDAAYRTIEATTQRVGHDPIRPLHRRHRTKFVHMRYSHLNIICYTDSLFANVKSKLNNTFGQLFVLERDYWAFYPLDTESSNHNALSDFIRHVGIPRQLHCDNAKSQKSAKWKKNTSEAQIFQTFTEPYSPFQNRTEGRIKMFKQRVTDLINKYNIPKILWDMVANYVCEIHNLTSSIILDGRTPSETVSSNTPGISEYTTFHLYDPCFYFDSIDAFTNTKEKLGRWMGVSHRIGQAMCY